MRSTCSTHSQIFILYPWCIHWCVSVWIVFLGWQNSFCHQLMRACKSAIDSGKRGNSRGCQECHNTKYTNNLENLIFKCFWGFAMKRNINFYAEVKIFWNWIRSKCHTIKIQWPEEEWAIESERNNERWEKIKSFNRQIESVDYRENGFYSASSRRSLFCAYNVHSVDPIELKKKFRSWMSFLCLCFRARATRQQAEVGSLRKWGKCTHIAYRNLKSRRFFLFLGTICYCWMSNLSGWWLSSNTWPLFFVYKMGIGIKHDVICY